MTTTTTTTPATNHTPTPWLSIPHDALCNCTEIANEIGYSRKTIAVGVNTSNAAFIVTACNSHHANLARIAELEDALRCIIAALDQPVQRSATNDTTARVLLGDCSFARKTAAAALQGGAK